MTLTTNILLLPRVGNFLPWPHDSFESTNYFFLGFTATTSTPTCFFFFFFKALYAATKMITKLSTSILRLETLSIYEGKHLYISQEIHTYNINNNNKTWLGFFLLYSRQNIKPYTSNELGPSWKNCKKKFCASFDRLSLIFDRSSLAESQ